MGNYSLNSIDLEEWGILAGQSPGSNIAVTGCFDMPKREGQSYYSWEDEDGIEPYTDADDIKFQGRDLVFYGFLKYGRYDAYKILKSLYDTIASFNGLVPFSTPFGTFQVYVISIIPTHFRTLTKVEIQMREPVVDLSGGILPAINNGYIRADKIPLDAFGLYVSAQKDRTSLNKMKSQYFTAYGEEGFQLSKRETSTLIIEGFMIAEDKADFMAKIKALQLLFSSSGLRTMDLSGEVEAKVFSESGFSIFNVRSGSRISAKFNMKLIIASERFYTSTDFYYSFPIVFPFTFGSDEAGGGLPIPLT